MRRYHPPEEKFGSARCRKCGTSFVKHRHGQRYCSRAHQQQAVAQRAERFRAIRAGRRDANGSNG